MASRRNRASAKAIAGTLAFYADAKAARDADRALEQAQAAAANYGRKAFANSAPNPHEGARMDLADSPIAVVIPGIPVAKARTKTQFKDRHGRELEKPHTFTPTQSKNYADLVQFYASRAMRKLDREPIAVEVSTHTVFYLPIPPSFWKAKARRAARGELRPGVRPDLSNLLKQIEDACNGIVFTDDAQICESHEYKFYDNGAGPRVLFTVAPLDLGPFK